MMIPRKWTKKHLRVVCVAERMYEWATANHPECLEKKHQPSSNLRPCALHVQGFGFGSDYVIDFANVIEMTATSYAID